MKRTKRKRRFLPAACLAAVFCGAFVFAALTDSVSVINHLETGDVDIGISEYSVLDGQETAYKSPETVTPGDRISKIPRITSYSASCWIRARISFTNSAKGQEGLSEALVGGIGKGWKKAGRYYYYTKPLNKGDSADLFSSVTIPADWTSGHNGQSLGLTIRADAIQSANFTPDFDAMSPWGNQKIEMCVHEMDDSVVARTQSVQNSVVYEGSAHKLVAAPDDFFGNFGVLMPGDTVSDSVEIKNTTDNTAEIFFSAGYENQTDEQVGLLKALEIQIRYDGKEIYKGKLTEESLSGGISLGKYAPGQGGKMDFTITMPASLGNAYARRNADVKWVFTVSEDTPSGTPSPASQGLSGDPAAEHSPQSTEAKPVKTGDDNDLELLMILLFVSAAFALAISFIRRRDN